MSVFSRISNIFGDFTHGSDDDDYLRVTPNKAITIGPWSTLPAAASTNRGALLMTEGDTDVADAVYVVLKSADGTYDTVPVVDGNGGLGTVVSNASAVFATPVVLTAADSNTTQLLDVATGIDFTLPAITADTIGMRFRFRLVTEVTSDSYRITAGEATDLFVGSVVMYDKDVAEGSTEALLQIFLPDVSDDDAITIAGADDTTGALVGGWLELEAITATRWFVTGSLIGDGALATIFS